MLGDYVQLAQLGTILSLFHYSRAMEAEADAMGARLLAEAGYPPIEMANVWEQLIGELDASAALPPQAPRAAVRPVRHPPVAGMRAWPTSGSRRPK